jgi:hypothetical protein
MVPGLLPHPKDHTPAAVFDPVAVAGRTSMPAGRIALSIALLAATLAMAPAASAQSGTLAPTQSDESGPPPTATAPAGTIGGPPPVAAEMCVEVDIAGYKAGHLDCASQRLQAATRQAQARAPNADSYDVPGARAPDVITGVANQTATRQRMGNQYGVGVRPQRPPPPVYGPPLMGPRKP